MRTVEPDKWREKLRPIFFEVASLNRAFEHTLDDPTVEKELRDSVFRVDNLADREAEKLERMGVRFDRVSKFISYLEKQEAAEHAGRDLAAIGGLIGEQFTPKMRADFDGERNWIETRLRENRERVREDIKLATEAELTESESDQGKLFEPETESESP